MLNARNLKLSFGSRVILDDVTFSLLAGDRVALVGQNGVGKSSLMRLLAGEPPDGGSVEMSKEISIGFLKQVPELDNEATVVETVRSAIAHHLEDIAKHQQSCEELATVTEEKARDRLIKRIDALAHRIDNSGGFDTEYWIETVLTRLGIKAREQKFGTLSGGERRRVDLARILLMAPDIYLLDEPTNHLDVGAIQFLIETFTKSTSALLFVSHDSAFVDELATRILELAHGKLYVHNPPFANYLENKLVRELIDERTLHRRERLVVGELAWLRAGTPARTTKQNARIDRAYELIDQVAKDTEIQRKKRLDIEASKTKRLGNTILELNQVGAAYGDRVVFKDFSLKVAAHQRYGILGPNGCGKTTLLSIISNKLVPTFGQITYGKNTLVIEFDQQREQLDQNKTLKETLADHGDYVRINNQDIHIASYLEKYLFSGGDANRRVSTLSGGEQNRLLLAKLFRVSANCLLLDEPTNDLDVTSLAVLEETLLDYDGVVFIVSHDRRFLDRVCTSIIAFEPSTDKEAQESTLTVYAGNYSDYARLKAKTEKEVPVAEVTKTNTKKLPSVKIKTKRSFKEEKEFQEIGEVIELLEEEQTTLHKELADGSLFRNEPGKVQEKIERLHTVEAKIEKLYGRWQELMDMGN